MKFWGIFRFELAYQIRRPWPWAMYAVMLVVCFLMTRDAAVQEALYEDFFVNAPFAVAVTTVVGGLLWLLVAPVVAGEAAARDVATGMYPLTYTSPLTRGEYLGGRFLAALVLNAILLTAVQLGALLAVYSPGVNPDLIAPFRLATYATSYAFLSLPNALFATAIQFAIATRSGRPMSSYLGSLLLAFMGVFVASLLLYSRGAGVLLDPIGIRFVVEDIAHLWTTAEKATRLLAFEGIIARNRLTWLGVGAVVAALTFVRFRFAHRTEGGLLRRFRRRRAAAQAPTPARIGISSSAPVDIPAVPRAFGAAMNARRTLAIAGASFRSIAKSWAGLGFFGFIPLLTILVLIDGMYSYGAPLVPTTGQVLQELTGPLTSELSRWVIVPLLTVFFAGELVWREREAGVDEIADASPVPEWVVMLGKLLGLAFLLAAFVAALMLAGIATQLIMGYRDFDFPLYFAALFGLQLTEYLLFAVLALGVHVVVGQKYVGHLVTIVLYIVILLAPMFGIEHNMLTYGAGPWWVFTEMRGVGPFIMPWLWFKLYWAAWALLLGIGARLLWLRGRETALRARLQLARRRLVGATAWAAALAIALVVGLGGFVFYNTNVLNEYVTAGQMAEQQAEYEKLYSRYARVPQPHAAVARMHIDVHPDERVVDIRGAYTLVNHTDRPIDSIHVAPIRIYDVRSLTFDRPATRVHDDARLGHHIYALRTPLEPGDSMEMRFDVHVARPGFREGGADVSIVPNGTLFTQFWMPAVGYQRMRELLGPGQRREHGLPERPVIPSLYDEAARATRTPGIVLDVVMSTDGDQTAVAPGALRRSWSEGGRNYFHYTTDGPIGAEWVFASAKYEVHEARWNDVQIRVLHHPEHATHPEGMVNSIKASLDYLTAEIAPFPYRHLTVVEVPGDGVGMHADASMLSHGEGITLLKVDESDMPFAVLAHEMSHQYAVPMAVVEGAPVIAESVAWYYALMIAEHTNGLDQRRRLMSFLRQPYPIAPIHRGEPLLRGLDQWMSYRKGPYALVAMAEYIGTGRVNAALRRLYASHEPQDAPLATTLDLYRELQAETPDSLRYLLHDLFEVNVFWQFRLERVRAEQTDAGSWQVTLDVHARKLLVDEAGVETELPMDENIQIGVFGQPEPGRYELSAPQHLEMHRIRAGAQTITITVPDRPTLAGIDPFHLLDWEENEDDDNVEWVETSDSES